MTLTEHQLAELGKALHRHLIVLDAMLRSNEAWVLDLHIPIATQLRVLLCDARLPMLLTYAAARGIPLRIWGPRPPGSALKTELLFDWNALVASWIPVSNGFEMSIEEYLETGRPSKVSRSTMMVYQGAVEEFEAVAREMKRT